MMAIEVPTQSCIRTSSGTPISRKTSYSTGTITAPPPIPNNPASNPVMTPAMTMARASQATRLMERRATSYFRVLHALDAAHTAPLKRNGFRLNRHFALAHCLSMIFSENRFPLFGIMLYAAMRPLSTTVSETRSSAAVSSSAPARAPRSTRKLAAERPRARNALEQAV